MRNRINKRINKLKQNLILVLLIALLFQTSLGQIRFITTFDTPKDHSEFARRPIEVKDGYLIPIHQLSNIGVLDTFFIAKVSETGKILSRKVFNDWVRDRGPLFNAGSTNIWKISIYNDSVDFTSFFRFQLYDSNLNEKLNIKIPRTFPTNSSLGLELYPYVELTNGDFIFMLDVMAIKWPPYGNVETYGCNFIYITKEGKIRANKTFNSFQLPNYIWQLNDTSIVFDVQLNGCGFADCRTIKVLDFNGKEIRNKDSNPFGFHKKYRNRYYTFWEYSQTFYKLVCYNENFDSFYEKKLPRSIEPLQFWDSRDNNDFRVRARYRELNTDSGFTGKSFETMMDTTFTWKKFKLFIGEAGDTLKDILDLTNDIKFYSTKDGGALYLCDKNIANSEYDLVVVKLDTIKWIDTARRIDTIELIDYLIYPNPNDGDYLLIKGKVWQTVSVYDAIGQKIVEHGNLSLNQAEPINIKNLRPGNYYLQIKFPDKTVYNKFIRY